MNRIRLKLYSPLEDVADAVELAEEVAASRPAPADILPFDASRRTVVISGRITPPVDRARLIHENRCCPDCHSNDVEPLELSDALISPRNRLPIPGTATLVGFHCNHCELEWPVYEMARRNG